MSKKVLSLFVMLFGAWVALAGYTVGKVYDLDYGWYEDGGLSDYNGRVSVGHCIAIPITSDWAYSLCNRYSWGEYYDYYDEGNAQVTVAPGTFGALGGVYVFSDQEMADQYGPNEKIWKNWTYSYDRFWVVVESTACIPTRGAKSFVLSLPKFSSYTQPTSDREEKTVSFTLVRDASAKASAADFEECEDCGQYVMTIPGANATFYCEGRTDMEVCEECGKVVSGGEVIPCLDECEFTEENATFEKGWRWRDANQTEWTFVESSIANGWAIAGYTLCGKAPASLTLPSSFHGRSVVEIADSSQAANETGTAKTYELKIPDTVKRIGSWILSDSEEITYSSVTIPASVSDIAEGAFAGFTSYDQTKFTSIVCQAKDFIVDNGGLYRLADNTLLAAVPATATKFAIRSGTTRIGDYAFENFTKLTAIDIPNSVEYIGDSAFAVCDSLTTISIPASVREIGRAAFGWCDKLTTVYVSANIKELPESMFAGCVSLSSVYLPESLETITVPFYADHRTRYDEETWEEEYYYEFLFLDTPFEACGKLKNVYFNGSAPDVMYEGWYYDENGEYHTGVPESLFSEDLLFRDVGYIQYSGLPYLEMKVGDVLPVTIHAVAGTDGWGESGTWCGRPLVFGSAWGDPNKKYDAIIVLPDGGKVTANGYGCYKVGAKVTFKASTTEKGAVFQGWYDASGVRVATGTSYAFTMPAANVTYYPKYILPADDYLYASIDEDIFYLDPGLYLEAGSRPNRRVGSVETLTEVSIKVTGLPNGLKIEYDELDNGLYLRGEIAANAKDASGWATIVLNNKTGYTKTIFLPYVIGYADEPYADYDRFHLGTFVRYTEDNVVKKVTGLPTGVAFDAKTHVVSGTPTKPGVYAITVTSTDGSSGTYTVIVADSGSLYLDVYTEGHGTVTGAGVYAAGATAKISAKPDKGYCFAGWYVNGVPCNELVSGDYRTPSDSLMVMPRDINELEARFVPEAEDMDIRLYFAECCIRPLPEITANAAAMVREASGMVNWSLVAESVTTPKIDVTASLPKGLAFTQRRLLNKDGSILAEANTIYGTATKPGTYIVTVKLTNTTVKKAIEKKFTITVPNLTSTVITGLDSDPDAYRFVAGETIPAIVPELAEAGWTIKVTDYPAGLKVDAKTGAITGASSAKPGIYTVTFTAKKKGYPDEIATISITIENRSLTLIAVGEGTGKLSGGGEYPAGKKVSLKATADTKDAAATSKGPATRKSVFAGWYYDEECLDPVDFGVDHRTTSVSLVTGAEDTTVYALFVPAEEDVDIGLFYLQHYCCSPDSEGEITDNAEETVFNTSGALKLALVAGSVTVPKIAISNLPDGLKFTDKLVTSKVTTGTGKDKVTTLVTNALPNTIYGMATKPGTYIVTAKLTNTTVKKAIEKKFTIVVDNLTGANDLLRVFDAEGNPADMLNARGEKYVISAGVAEPGLPTLRPLNAGDKVTFSGLPTGLKYDAMTGKITGTATGEGVYTVQVKVGKALSTFTVEVEPLPDWVEGTFETFTVRGDEFEYRIVMTITSKGEVSCKAYEVDSKVNTTAFKLKLLRRQEDGGFFFDMTRSGVRHSGKPWDDYHKWIITPHDVEGIRFGVVRGEGYEREWYKDYRNGEGYYAESNDIVNFGVQNVWSRGAGSALLPEIAKGAQVLLDMSDWTQRGFESEDYECKLHGCSLALVYGKDGTMSVAFYENGVVKATAGTVLVPYELSEDGKILKAMATTVFAPPGREAVSLALFFDIDVSGGLVNGRDFKLDHYYMEIQ